MTRLWSWCRSFGRFVVEVAAGAWAEVRAWSPARKIVAALVALALVALFFFIDVPDLAALRALADELGPWFALAFTAAYVFFTQFPVPRTVWTVAAGIFFGPWAGLLVSLIALTISATISLLLVRGVLGSWIRPHLTHPAVYKINVHLERRGWLAVGSLRMVAGVPFSLLNYLAALSPIRVLPFALATLIGSIPTTALGVIFGDTIISGGNPWALFAALIFAAAGLVGLYLDARLPLPVGRSRRLANAR